MYYGELKKCDIANGIGVRVTLFVSGCTNRCPGCFQPQVESGILEVACANILREFFRTLRRNRASAPDAEL